MLSWPYSRPSTRPAWLRYGVAILCALAGLLLRQAISPGVGPTALPFIFFFPFIAVAAWFGGFGPGVVAMALGGLAAAKFFFEPFDDLPRSYDLWALASFGVACLVIIGAIQTMHYARAELTRSRD